MNSGLEGRWDRNRTCNLRLRSLLPFVQGRSRNGWKLTFVGVENTVKVTNYVDVHQLSPVLGQTN